jgi:Tol biopolymer transport system component
VLGTVSYMSPEQAEGRSVDSRSDVFSLGAMLFEMATGRQLFRGSSSLQIMTSILRDPVPSLLDINPRQAVELVPVLERCLEKRPNDRYHSAHDLAHELHVVRQRVHRSFRTDSGIEPEDHRDSSLSGSGSRARSGDQRGSAAVEARSASPAKPRDWSFPKAPARSSVAAVAIVAVGAGVWWRLDAPRRPRTEREIYAVVTERGLTQEPDWSPDSEWVVYASDRDGNVDLWRRPPGGGSAERLTRSPFNDTQPAWSPDGRSIAFVSDRDGGGIYLMPAAGGELFRVTEIGSDPRWSPDGRQLLFHWFGTVYRVSATGGEPQPLFHAGGLPLADWSADGKKVVFWDQSAQDIVLGTADGEMLEPLRLVETGNEVSGLDLARDGRRLVFSKGPFGGFKNLWSVALDPDSTLPIAAAERLTLAPSQDVECHLSADGARVVYTSQQIDRRLWSFRLDDRTATLLDEGSAVEIEGRNALYPALSPDGKTLVWTSQSRGQGVLFFKRFDQAGEHKLTSSWALDTREVTPSFGPKGELAFASTQDGSYELWRIPSIGAVPLPVTHTEASAMDSGVSWSPTGRHLAFHSTRSGSWDLWLVDPESRLEPRRVTFSDDHHERSPSWSPDGKTLAYLSDEGESPDLWLLDIETGQTRPFDVHPAEEGWSAWSPQGRWIYFASSRNGVFNIWAKPVAGDEAAHQVTRFDPGDPSGLPENPIYSRFALTADVLILPVETRTSEIYVLEESVVEQ